MSKILIKLSDFEDPMPTGIMFAHIEDITKVADQVGNHFNYSLTLYCGNVPRKVYVNVFPNSANFLSLINELYVRYDVDPEAEICLDDHVNTDVRISLSVTHGANDKVYYVIDWYEPINNDEVLPF